MPGKWDSDRVGLRSVEHPARPAASRALDLTSHRISIVAPAEAAAAAMLLLPPSRHVLTFSSASSASTALGDVALVVLDSDVAVHAPPSVPWIAWNRSGLDAVALAAYERGARTVLPADVDGLAVLAALERLADVDRSSSAGPGHGRRRFAEGARIALGADQVLSIESGVVAQRVIHADGTQVLIGLFGARRIVIGHPDDSCCLELVAHTDTEAVCQPWQDAEAAPGFATAMRARLRQMEAWAAAQARPHLDGRLLGVLSVLAEQFGRPYPRGVLIDVRLTHDQLASATAATRATVTRALGQLRHRGMVWSVDSGAGRRFCIDHAHTHDHGRP